MTSRSTFWFKPNFAMERLHCKPICHYTFDSSERLIECALSSLFFYP